MLVKCVLLLLCYCLLLGSTDSEFTSTVYPAIVPSSQCGQYNPAQDADLMTALQQIKQHLSMKQIHGTSCKSIHTTNPLAPSGYYQIQNATGSIVKVYCDMEGTNCGGEGGWTRLAYINMAQPGATCPQGLEQMMIDGSLYCGWLSPGSGCVSAVFNSTISYQQVCGQVAGYQQNSPGAFFSVDINHEYFTGIAIMHGIPRKHIWTYANSYYSAATNVWTCPCNNGSATYLLPDFVGNDYYCESGNQEDSNICYRVNLATNDVLWDGQQCGGIESTCCTHPNMPWFIKTLNETTTDNIELRACGNNINCWGTAPVFLIELYIR